MLPTKKVLYGTHFIQNIADQNQFWGEIILLYVILGSNKKAGMGIINPIAHIKIRRVMLRN